MMTIIILILGIILFVTSLLLCIFSQSIASALLNFLSTVIVSWLISNISNKKEFKKAQEDLAKVSYRHLGDVEKSALSIEQSIKDYIHECGGDETGNSDKYVLFLKTLDSRMDDLKDRIKSTNKDWYDLLSDDAKREVRDAEDPEAKTVTDQATGNSKPDLSSIASAYGETVEDNKDACMQKEACM